MEQIRKARLQDASTLWRIRTEAIRRLCSTAYRPEDIARWSASPMPQGFELLFELEPFLVAERDGVILGWGAVSVPNAEVEAMFVDPAQVRTGVGRRLLAELERWARERGVTSLTLLSSLNAVPFYMACGYGHPRDDIYHHPSGLKLPSVRLEKRL